LMRKDRGVFPGTVTWRSSFQVATTTDPYSGYRSNCGRLALRKAKRWRDAANAFKLERKSLKCWCCPKMRPCETAATNSAELLMKLGAGKSRNSRPSNNGWLMPRLDCLAETRKSEDVQLAPAHEQGS